MNAKVKEKPAAVDQADVSPEAAVRARTIPQLAAQDIHTDGVRWSRWGVVCLAEHTIEDVLHPRFLFNRAEQIKPLDYIEIKHPYGLFVVCLDVVRVDFAGRGIITYPRHIHDYSKADALEPDLSTARIEFLGDRSWCLVDGHHVVKEGFGTREDAKAWLAAKIKD